jgi:hypothetical protein
MFFLTHHELALSCWLVSAGLGWPEEDEDRIAALVELGA